jgi:UDP-3-O-[3-hydroxymyristoyl] glucosamine N-acyltransferase
MEFTALQIAGLLNGKVDGDPEATVSTIAKIEEGSKQSLSFLANPKYTPYIYTTLSAIVIVNEDFKPEKPVPTLIRVPDAYAAFARLLEIYQSMQLDKTGISSLAFVSEKAVLGKDLYIGEFAFVGDNVSLGNKVKIYPQVYIGDNCKIGNGTIIHPGVKLYAGTQLGENCIIHAGVVIGSDGFGFVPDADNQYKKVPQTGHVIVEDDVEIGANTTIDRATLGATIIRKGVKLDNLIQVAHNVEIGENTVIAAQTGISGSTKVGRNCMFGGQVGLAGHIVVADGVKLNAQSGVPSSLKEENQVLMGSPVMPIKDYMRSVIHLRQFDKLAKRVQELETKLDKLSQ